MDDMTLGGTFANGPPIICLHLELATSWYPNKNDLLQSGYPDTTDIYVLYIYITLQWTLKIRVPFLKRGPL